MSAKAGQVPLTGREIVLGDGSCDERGGRHDRPRRTLRLSATEARRVEPVLCYGRGVPPRIEFSPLVMR